MSGIEKVLIIGSGCAGLTAAIYASRASLSPLVICGMQPGGQLTTTNGVENFPGFPSGIYGFELTNSMRLQAERFGTRFIDGVVKGADFSKDVKVVQCANEEYFAETVIVATGSSPKLLGVDGEEKFFGGGGVSVCATCDGAFYRGRDVAVIGGGDTACEEALFLSNFCKAVYLVHRRDVLRASQLMRERVLNNGKITPIWNSVVSKIVGDDKVSGLVLENSTGGGQRELSCAGVFLAIGHIPNTKPFSANLALDESGYIRHKNGSFVETSADGVFAAGDCADSVYRQAITSAGTGAMAAIAAEKYLTQRV
jgi:thioredoxin reductase (NADPH)